MDLDFDPEKLQRMLAEVQASNQVICARYTYPNPVYDDSKDSRKTGAPDKCPEMITKVADSFFKKKLPDYRLANLLTDKLTQNVLKLLNKESPTVTIPNGCCSSKDCPTKLYYECVLDAVDLFMKL